MPPYIHFTLHKSNRETQDALGHISRMIGCHPRDLTVCGTKDKRAVTVQRVCLKRGDRTLTSVWRTLNGIKQGKRSEKVAMEQRGERGVRIGDMCYSHEMLDLGMLKGNKFTITLRSVEGDRQDEIKVILDSLRDHGFINFYGESSVESGCAELRSGMQRFGTSTVPTHVTGLHLLKGQWKDAVDSVLSLREGEHPECVAARLAWLEDGDHAKALRLMPRRSVAERSVWEYWGRGNRVEDSLGAINNVRRYTRISHNGAISLRQIPRNLKTMYAHAYQSYVWNLIASERVKLSATEPLVGDLVYANSKEDDDEDEAEGELAGSSIPGLHVDIRQRPSGSRTTAGRIRCRREAAHRRGPSELHHI